MMYVMKDAVLMNQNHRVSWHVGCWKLGAGSWHLHVAASDLPHTHTHTHTHTQTQTHKHIHTRRPSEDPCKQSDGEWSFPQDIWRHEMAADSQGSCICTSPASIVPSRSRPRCSLPNTLSRPCLVREHAWLPRAPARKPLSNPATKSAPTTTTCSTHHVLSGGAASIAWQRKGGV